MLKKEEVQAILDRFLQLKTVKPGAKGKPVAQNNETLINARKESLNKKQADGAGQSLYIKNQTCNLEIKTNDSKPYYPVKMNKFDGNQVLCTLFESEMKDCKVPDFKKANFPVAPELTFEFSQMADRGIEDMVEIDELNPATLLFNLANRYKRDDIYTYVGPILLAANPFKAVPRLDTPELKAQCMNIKDDPAPLQLKKNLQPHIWVVSCLAYRQLRDTKQRQAIVISGESGAGKTESARISMNLLADLGSGDKAELPAGTVPIGEAILKCNPVLEGFGNAKTSRNDNSSRFGKYTLMYFGLNEEAIYGARVQNYLLEKSRVVSVTNQERGYHIFYFLLRGGPKELLKTLGLLDKKGERMSPFEFNFLKQTCDKALWGDLPEKHDIDGYNEVQDTFTTLKFTELEQISVWKTVSSVLLLGQIDFDKLSFENIHSNKEGVIKNMDIVQLICGLLGIKKVDNFKKMLLNTRTKVKADISWTALSQKQCIDNRDAFAKQIYNNMFDWLVVRMNVTIQPPQINDPSFKDKSKTIGLLDIFGFENFEPQSRNNYEQMCINYVNEKLHKLYIAAIFEAECIELKQEGLGDMVAAIQYPDLKVLEVIRLLDFKQGSAKYAGIKFATPPGIGLFTMIDDSCTAVIKGATVKWEDTASSFDQNHGKNVRIYKHDRTTQGKNFTILHSAQDVKYAMTEFVARNVDFIPDEYMELMKDETDETISCIFQVILTKDQPIDEKKKLKTIWQKFDIQMINLMEELAEPLLQMGEEKQKTIPEGLEDTKLHFIRCIKPRLKPDRPDPTPGFFCHSMTLQQITYMGVLESVDLKQKNFPIRKRWEEFYAEYELLSPRYAQKRYYQMDKGAEDFAALSKEIVLTQMQGLGLDLYALGNQKVLMMPEPKSILEECKKIAAQKRDAAAQVLKKAFTILFGAQLGNQRLRYMETVQVVRKYRHKKLKKNWAKQFQQNFERAIINFKSEKRKAFEVKAGQIMKNTLRKHCFRNKLSNAIKSREVVLKFLHNHCWITKLRKFLVSSIIANRIQSDAFKRARQRIDGKSAWELQRALRGYIARNKGERLSWVTSAIESKQNLRLHVSAKKIQKRLRGLIIRRRLQVFSKAASIIQAYFRMTVIRKLFQMIKKNVCVLQRGVRRYMARRDCIKQRMSDYLTQEFQVMANVQEMEHFQLFGDDGNPALIKQHTPYSVKKIQIMERVIDLHVVSDLSETFSIPWASQWMQIYKENIASETPIMKLIVGTTHSFACNGRGKAYAWGWNDNGQCAQNPLIHDEIIVKNSSKPALIEFPNPKNAQDQFGGIKCKQVFAAEDRTFVLAQDSLDLMAWGGNEKGQLGLGHYQDVYVPTKIEFFAKAGQKVVSVATGGNLTLACTENGDSYGWPFTKGGQKYSIPIRMPFSERIKIVRVSCGHNFGFFISLQGLVYSVGKDNQDGQLGLGHRYPNDIPELVGCFKQAGERIDQIECGYRHAIARSTLGKVYTWGWNGHGQLGHGTFDSELSPRLLVLERGGQLKREKVQQISAGFSHTVIMTETNREIVWFGTSGYLHKQSTPCLLNLSEKLKSLFPETNSIVQALGHQTDFAVVRVNCDWSKSMSVTNLTIVDLRAVNQDQSYNKIREVLNQLSTKWDQREVMPPFIEVISGLFSANIMRKPSNYVPVIPRKQDGHQTRLQADLSQQVHSTPGKKPSTAKK